MHLSGRNSFVVSYDIMDPSGAKVLRHERYWVSYHYSVFRAIKPRGRLSLPYGLLDREPGGNIDH